MKARVLKVLMWKHTVVRVRRFIHTTIDFVSPLMFLILLFCFKHFIQHVDLESDNAVADTDELQLTDTMSAPHRILYYPDTPLTAALMDDVGPKLNLGRLDHFPGARENGYYAYSNESQIAEFMSKMRLTEAIVIFRDMSAESWPERLNYTIRMKDVFRTESYESQDDTPGPHKMFGLNYGTFMRIQWAIDTSYIKLLTGSEVPQTVSLKEFPYYHTRRNANTFYVCRIVISMSWLSLMLTFVFLVGRLLQERASGIQELMKMVGVSLNTLGVSHFLNVLPCGLIFSIGGTILLKVSSAPLIPNTNGFLIFLLMLLYFNSVIALAFVTSYISRGTQYSSTLSVMAYVVLWIPVSVLESKNVPYVLNVITGLVPHRPMHWFWDEVAALEIYGSGATFSNMMKTHVYNNGSILFSYIFLILQAAIFYFIAWYLSLTRPGQYGQALPWNFFFKAEYWNKSKNEVKPDTDLEEEDPITQDPKYFEKAPANAEVGIKVVNVSKMYQKNRVLRNVSLEVYKGEITVLLGHNGAGKTTLMSIITGMTSATEGKVYVNGKDTVSQQDEVRQNIGLCPQQNLFFSDLTVLEQIKFFYLLKRGTFSQANKSARELADQLFLKDKLNSLIRELSGGMKRRAQVACALAGGSSVLILDEPTSGLDVETRRELWDLLLSLRGDRTVLLTTHFMEEADALGDRVAALHAGVLRCCATTMYLKKAVGTGYRLSFTTIGAPKEQLITKTVQSHVPDASVKEKTINSISYSLPAAASKKFPKLFTVLESMRSTLGIDSIGVGVSTLEEVFLKLCSDVDTALFDDELDNIPEQEVQLKKISGVPLYLHQMKVLMTRQVQYAMHKWIVFLILQVILPVLVIFVMTHVMNNVDVPATRSLPMNLDIYGDRSNRRALYKVEAPDVTPDVVTKQYPRVAFTNTHDVAEAVLRTAEKDILEYNKYLVGVELNETDAKILYTTTVRHAAPVALNLLSNMLATRYISWADGHTINTLNEPIQGRGLLEQLKEQPKDLMLIITYGICMTFIILATNINCISLPCKERETGSRHIHVMSGCPAELHWVTTLIWHLLLCIVTLIIPTILAAALLDTDNTINQPDFLAVFMLVLILGSLSFLAFMYLVSFNQGERTTSIVLVACIMVFGLLTPFMKSAQDAFEENPRGMTHMVLVFCGWVAPPHTMVMTALRTLMVARTNAWCHIMKDRCPAIFVPERGFDAEKCCAGENPRCYFCIDDYSPGLGMCILIVQATLLMIMVVLTERGFFNGLSDKIMNMRYRPVMTPDLDDMVRAEREYVSKAITLPVKQIPDAMLVDDLHKNYVPLIKKNCNAVKGISFSVKKGECFGLLGVNGAGKSTTFKMLTAEEHATKGNIFGNGYHLKRGNSQYLQTLGYCPQFFGLDMFLTGEQNLRLVLTLRGFDQQQVKEEVKSWIQVVGLEKYARRKVDTYSGGCVRRLGAAAALCGRADLVMLDEPTAGVDVAARRKLWTALRIALRHQRSVIITSHSMDEMEALCSRIAILAGGRVRALGTAAGLRAAHAQGHAVVFKLRHIAPHSADQVDDARAKPQMNLLKGKVQEKFDCTLKDEHKTMLHYHINETMRYSNLFTELENLRKEFHNFIEDYSVTETTLEEVFLAFAKEQQTGPQTA